MEFQPGRVEIMFPGGGAGFPLEFLYSVDWNFKANKNYFSCEHRHDRKIESDSNWEYFSECTAINVGDAMNVGDAINEGDAINVGHAMNVGDAINEGDAMNVGEMP